MFDWTDRRLNEPPRLSRFALSEGLREYQLRYLITATCGVALIDKLDLLYSINPKFLDREGFRRLLRSFKLITSTILHYLVFSLLILMVCAINMTKFVGMNRNFVESTTGEGTENEALWGNFGWWTP